MTDPYEELAATIDKIVTSTFVTPVGPEFLDSVLDAAFEKANVALDYRGEFEPTEVVITEAFEVMPHEQIVAISFDGGLPSSSLAELVPMIQAAQITRKHKSYPAPREAWILAFNRCIEARDLGKLQTPLTGHGFLLENLTFWTPQKTTAATVLPSPQPSPTREGAVSTKLRDGVGGLIAWAQKGGGD